MGSSSNKNLEGNKNQKQIKFKCSSSSKNSKENKYKCTIKLDEAEVPGFLCDFKYLGQSKLVPTIITYKSLFPGDFNFKEENKGIIIRYDYNKNLKVNSKIKRIIYDNYNIVIFLISDLSNISYLNIYVNIPNKFHFYKLFDLKNNINKLLDCSIEFSIHPKDYIFSYYSKKNEHKKYKNSLVLNKYNEIIGITISSEHYKGITINGIIKEIKENQKNKKENDEKKNIEVIKPNSDDNNNHENNIIIHNNINNDNSNNHILNKNIINLKITDNKNDNNIKLDDNNNNNCKIIKKSGKKKVKEKEKEENLNVMIINKKDIENDKEINLYFLFKNRKELYLDVKESLCFDEVIKQLNEKYLWLKNIEIKEYQFEKTKIYGKKSLKDNNLKDNSIIDIIEYH